MTAIELLDVLTNLLVDPENKIGGNLLGTYTYESGESGPAIAVGTPSDDIQVIGLECNIPLVADATTEWAGVSVLSQESWDVSLIQRETAITAEGYPESPKLPAAVDRLKRFLVSSEGVYLPADDLLETYPQYRITFPNWALKNVILNH